LKAKDEHKTFSVYQKDSSLDAASKLVKNFKLENDMVSYFAAYIEERRAEIRTNNYPGNETYSPEHSHNQGNFMSILLTLAF
jgi:hypothetical protein